MIKIKVLNPFNDRNEPTFRPFQFIRDMLYSDYSIELTTDNDFDFMFVGMSDFFDKDKSLKESTEWGLDNLNKVTEGGDYFLFDGQDSTSIMGSYEVFEQSDAIYMFKNQTLNKRLRPFNDIGFVPTMGGIHKGHISLIKKSNKVCKKTIISRS